jgi:outer membrane protein assembly factor BamB
MVLALGALEARGGDWPQFRGDPSLQGVTKDLLPAEPSLRWQFKTKGPIKSSPAIVQGRVFVGSDDGHLYAVDLKDGKPLWQFKTEGAVESSPLALDGRVYVGSGDSFVYALEAASGKLLWKFETGDKVVAGPNWVKDGDRTSILVGSYDFKCYSLDAGTGKSNWVYESSNYINATPAVADGKTVFGGCDGMLHVVSVKDGQQIKQIEAGAYVAGSAALAGGRAYFGHFENRFLCFDLETANQVWSFRDRNFPFYSSPALTADRVVFGGRDRMLHCVKRGDGTAVWRLPTRGKVDSSPAIAGDKVVVGSDDGRVYLVDLETGKELWTYEVGEAIASSPAISGNRFVVGADDGVLYCFGPKP